jgi:hypothetical protein
MKVKNSVSLIENYITLKKSFKVRKSPNIIEIVTSSGQKIYEHRNERFKEGLYLFNMVKRDIEAYLSENGYIEPYDELPVNYSNKEFDYDNKVVGMDINNAYWSVAYLKGYISKKTYERGLEQKDGMKSIRLSCLSTLGKARLYEVYEDGKLIGEEAVNNDEQLQAIYKDIRFSTYGVMNEIANDLENDFCCWKTDCVFFKDTTNNRVKVKEIIESYGLSCKVEEVKSSALKK